MKQQAVTISFEFFPPKTPEGNEALYATAKVLAHYHPHFYSVTYGAGGSTRLGTLETVKMLLTNTSIPVTPHIACIGASREDIIELLHHYQALGINRLVALRGDLPSGMGHSGEFKYANELVSLIREVTTNHFHIEVAAYPECHPQAVTAEQEIIVLKKKYEAGANSAITQYFFNADAYFYYLDDCAKHQVYMPIVPGIMPITQFSKLARFSDLCGAEIPRWIRKRLESYGDDLESIKKFGLEVVYDLCQKLLAGGAPGLHFYTLNKADAVVELLHLLQPQIKHIAELPTLEKVKLEPHQTLSSRRRPGPISQLP